MAEASGLRQINHDGRPAASVVSLGRVTWLDVGAAEAGVSIGAPEAAAIRVGDHLIGFQPSASDIGVLRVTR